jgi:two-component system sensor histidine kinase CpxA
MIALRPRRRLGTKVLLIAFLNLTLLAILFALFARIQYRVGFNSFLFTPTHDRILSVSRQIALDLTESDRSNWSALIKQQEALNDVELWLLDETDRVLVGADRPIPREVMTQVSLPENDKSNSDVKGTKGEKSLVFLATTINPDRRWAAVRIPLPTPGSAIPVRGVLIAAASSWKGGLFFFDPFPWLAVAGVVLLISALFWLPLVRGLNRSISQITQATGWIADGRFDLRLPEDGADELGNLSASINRMSSRLDGLVKGQKRFLGDTAHELCSPLARIQVAVGILESQAGALNQNALASLRDDVEHLSKLVNELLSFSKAEFRPKEVKLEPVLLRETIDNVLAREARDGLRIDVKVEPNLRVMAALGLLGRALSNVVRNSIRYAADQGPIEIDARVEQDTVVIRVSDCGPGIPEQDLQAVFDPFYRPDIARERGAGGVGLGLAIVRTCIDACQGTVLCRNVSPSGLQVEITLKSA